jgi:hypothetical protein
MSLRTGGLNLNQRVVMSLRTGRLNLNQRVASTYGRHVDERRRAKSAGAEGSYIPLACGSEGKDLGCKQYFHARYNV